MGSVVMRGCVDSQNLTHYEKKYVQISPVRFLVTVWVCLHPGSVARETNLAQGNPVKFVVIAWVSLHPGHIARQTNLVQVQRGLMSLCGCVDAHNMLREKQILCK